MILYISILSWERWKRQVEISLQSIGLADDLILMLIWLQMQKIALMNLEN